MFAAFYLPGLRKARDEITRMIEAFELDFEAATRNTSQTQTSHLNGSDVTAETTGTGKVGRILAVQRKQHWTQTPEGKAKMRRAMKKSWAARRLVGKR